jgi:hypothetical protein
MPRRRRAEALLTPEEAIAAAEQEGLTLVPGPGATGFKAVIRWNNSKTPQTAYKIQLTENGMNVNFGYFMCAEAASLAYARYLGPKGSAAKATAQDPPITAEEALEAAALEGLTLVPSFKNETGFKHVNFYPNTVHPYAVKSRVGYLGRFATAEEGALTYARVLGPAGSAAEAADCIRDADPGMTAEEVDAAAEREGLTLVPSSRPTATNFKGVGKLDGPPCGQQKTCYVPKYWKDSRSEYLGSFRTAKEAALAYARHLGPEESAAAAAETAEIRGLTPPVSKRQQTEVVRQYPKRVKVAATAVGDNPTSGDDEAVQIVILDARIVA